MIKWILSSIMIFITFSMVFMKHPLSMGLMILIQTLLICLISGLYIYTYWFSYILFLTFLGGLLVLFIYVASIASNEMFSFPLKNKMFLMIFLISILFFILIIKIKFNWLNLIFNHFEYNNFMNYLLLFINNNNNINLTKLYNEQNYLLMLMMIIYLFITLIAVVKITNIFYGPLRSN
uniref:NADH dehydrogenase subunit 6 n=1 Tax=Gerosis phisara TaxID=1908728 RepID=UPI001EDFD05F|nr:NADH dehydrogenase subunit 6 [Gerosis phisara]YP_010968390.1 NADH dehydrogenase subunit 6 [Gerosis sinica]UJV31539.1 NADH dehydrogenase subunit 6 [Gerosis phisara]WNO18702.1 NADH dehydrogenase subunit 6 [Gerosis sinica]